MADNASAKLNAAKHLAFVNGKYHADRESFLDFWDKLITFAVLLSGAAAFADVFGVAAQRIGAASLSLFALIQLVYTLPIKARKHADFRSRYFEIASRMQVNDLSPDLAHAQMTKIAGEEDPPYCAVHALAENWATCAIYGARRQLPCEVSWVRKKLRHV